MFTLRASTCISGVPSEFQYVRFSVCLSVCPKCLQFMRGYADADYINCINFVSVSSVDHFVCLILRIFGNK